MGNFFRDKSLELSRKLQETSVVQEYRRQSSEWIKEVPKSKYTNLKSFLEKIAKERTSEKTKAEPILKDAVLVRIGEELEVKGEGIEVKELEEGKNFLEKEYPEKDYFEAICDSNFSKSVFLKIPKSAKERVFVEIVQEENAKITVSVEENCDTFILHRVVGNLATSSLNAFAGENSRIEFVYSHESLQEVAVARNFFLERDAKLYSSNAWISGKEAKGMQRNILEGQGAEAFQSDLLFSNEKQHFDLKSLNLHKAENCQSFTVYKGVLKDESSAVFDGMIKVAKSAQKTNALLEAHSMLLSKKCQSNNIPGLEIEADDVKCTHSASTSQLDEEQLFYLTSRGLSLEEAKKMIVLGFLGTVLAKISKEEAREFFQKILEEKYKGE